MSDQARLTAWVHGHVQGVGFRWWTRSRALELGLTGYAANQVDGRVLVVAQGSRQACEQLLSLLRGGDTAGSVDTVVAELGDPGVDRPLARVDAEGLTAVPDGVLGEEADEAVGVVALVARLRIVNLQLRDRLDGLEPCEPSLQGFTHGREPNRFPEGARCGRMVAWTSG